MIVFETVHVRGFLFLRKEIMLLLITKNENESNLERIQSLPSIQFWVNITQRGRGVTFLHNYVIKLMLIVIILQTSPSKKKNFRVIRNENTVFINDTSILATSSGEFQPFPSTIRIVRLFEDKIWTA